MSGPSLSETVQLPAATTSLAAADAYQQPALVLQLPAVGPPSPAQISLLIDDFRNQDLATRLNAFKKITVIAHALGIKRTREELIPYLAEFCDDDDEVLLVLSSTLGEMVELVGGAEYAYVLLNPLEQLAGTEEEAVRKQSIASIAKISAQISEAHLLEHVLPLQRRLATAEWFTSRISSAGLFHVLYPRLPESGRTELRALFLHLCRNDETPMVKRAATSHLGEFAAVIEPRLVYEEMFPVLQKMAKDEQDSVRLLTVDACVAMAKIFGKDNKALNVTKMTQLIKGLISDPSWRVRYMVGDKFCDLSSALGAGIAQSDALLDDYVKLLSDPEPEVRTASATRVGDIAKLAGEQQTIKKFFKPMNQGKTPTQSVLQAICADTDEATSFTRAALAGVLMAIATVLKPRDVREYLLPLILSTLRDKNSEVRLNLLSKFETIPNLREVLPLDEINEQILASINDDEGGLAKNPKWRVRLQVIQLIPTLAKQLGEEFFDAKLSDLCMEWLGDSVWSIREAATANLTKLADAFGVEWAKKNIIPKVIALGSHKSYLYRMTAVFAIQDMATILGPQLTTERLLPVVVKLANDPVANVRFNSARVLGTLMTSGALILPQPLVEHTLANLKSDTDSDVRYYSDSALAEINKPH